jgi:MFS transporter, SP family, arabinose:H+ symporter
MHATIESGLPRAASDPLAAASQGRRIVAAAVCSLGGLIFGYDLGALAGATQGLLHAYSLSPARFGFTVSVSLWGALCASPIAGRLADRLGRRGLLAVCAGLYLFAATAIVLPAHWPWCAVIALRLFSGLAIGGFVVGCPLYLAEIAPRALRGRYVGWFQLQIAAGVVAAFAVSAGIAAHMPETAEWKWCFGFGAIPSACLLLLLHWVPEEPQWLARRGRWSEAAAASSRLGLAPSEWPGASGTGACQHSRPREERLFQRRYLRPLLLAASVALFNQFCGATVLRVYLIDLLASTGMGRALSHRYAVVLALFNLAALLPGMWLVDRIGRKPLLIAGSAGMALCLFLLVSGLRQHSAAPFYLFILAAYNTFFACSQGAAAWTYLSEIFPFPVRGKGQGFGALIHWIANAGLIAVFPAIQAKAPQSGFLLFGSLMILQVVVVSLWYPETKGTHLGAAGELAIRV